MFTHTLSRAAFIHFEDQADGTVLTVLQVFTAVPLAPSSVAGQRLVSAVVNHMQRFPHIDRADIN